MKSAFDVAADLFVPTVDYVADPELWATERLKAELWSKQTEIVVSVRDNRNTAVHSCHSAGKSFTAAAVACWWIDSHPPGTAFVVTSAPTGDQVKAILWREIGRMHKAAGLPGRTNLTEWYINSELVALGRKPNDYEPTAFQGIHAIYILIILDEACGIPPMLWDATSTLASNEAGRVLAIGNPDDPNGQFSRVCGSPAWNVIHISAFDTPNFTGEPVSELVRQSLISKSWVDEKRVEWGEESALYSSKVLGQFPRDSESGVIPLSMVERCRENELAPGLPVELGVDIGAGGDETVVTPRRGAKAGVPWRTRHDDPMRCVGEIVGWIHESGAVRLKIDVIGVGWGVAGRLQELRDEGVHQCEVMKVNVAEKSSQPKRFLNKRAELWWDVGRENSRLRSWDLSEIDDGTVAELTAHEYEIVDSSGKIKVQSKDDVRKKLGRSPDSADSLLLAFYEPWGEAESITTTSGGNVEVRLPGTDRYRR